MSEEVAIAWSKDKAGPELERIVPGAMLTEPRGFGAGAGCGVVAAENVEQIAGFQFSRFVGESLGINEQWKSDACFLAKEARIAYVAEANGSQGRPGLRDLGLMLAQLRDMLAAEDSPVVAEEHHDGWLALPQRAEANFRTCGFR